MNAWKHLKTINHHKMLVMKGCFRVGLYKQGLLHDLSKYSPAEFLPGCRYYTGKESPHNIERKEKGYSSAWLHHKGRNKHHLEYWTDYGTDGEKKIAGMKMPLKYVVEMFCDRVAASQTYQPAGILREWEEGVSSARRHKGALREAFAYAGGAGGGRDVPLHQGRPAQAKRILRILSKYRQAARTGGKALQRLIFHRM